MINGFTPKVNITPVMQTMTGDTGLSATKFNNIAKSEEAKDFKTVFSGMVNETNATLNAPDALLKDAVMGVNNVDVHDVMTAMSKAELSITIMTNVTTKVIQAYDKISQIQV